jgi:hypothetical protein
VPPALAIADCLRIATARVKSALVGSWKSLSSMITVARKRLIGNVKTPKRKASKKLPATETITTARIIAFALALPRVP